ncbi:hypothetical protein SAMN04489747_2172 [Auraticoccus monumenti]|uniref:Uncharacterized protein n=1 Tax=Auraticoccus monumenti TaxID=675864 RepID=A0A1G6Z2Q6_9ACTN|nr:hypothetical protein SAMN04489747_2172 [Auraticoccus monumenti]
MRSEAAPSCRRRVAAICRVSTGRGDVWRPVATPNWRASGAASVQRAASGPDVSGPGRARRRLAASRHLARRALRCCPKLQATTGRDLSRHHRPRRRLPASRDVHWRASGAPRRCRAGGDWPRSVASPPAEATSAGKSPRSLACVRRRGGDWPICVRSRPDEPTSGGESPPPLASVRRHPRVAGGDWPRSVGSTPGEPTSGGESPPPLANVRRRLGAAGGEWPRSVASAPAEATSGGQSPPPPPAGERSAPPRCRGRRVAAMCRNQASRGDVWRRVATSRRRGDRRYRGREAVQRGAEGTGGVDRVVVAAAASSRRDHPRGTRGALPTWPGLVGRPGPVGVSVCAPCARRRAGRRSQRSRSRPRRTRPRRPGRCRRATHHPVRSPPPAAPARRRASRGPPRRAR